MTAALIDVLFTLSIALLFIRQVAIDTDTQTLWKRSFHGSFEIQKWKRGLTEQMYDDMVRYANFIGKPEWALQCYRWGFAIPIILVILFVVLQWYILLVLVPLTYFLPYYWLLSKYRRCRSLLRRQTREFRLTTAIVADTGAPQDKVILIATETTEFPLRPYLNDLCASVGYGASGELRLETVADAFKTLAERINIQEMTQFAQLISQGVKYNIPLTETLFKSLEIEEKARDANAEEAIGKSLSTLSLLATTLVSMPTFVFLIFAVASYALQMLGGTGLGLGS